MTVNQGTFHTALVVSRIEIEEEDLFEWFMEEILASLEATSTEHRSAKRVTTAI